MIVDTNKSSETAGGVSNLDKLTDEELPVQSVQPQKQEEWTAYLAYCNAVLILGASVMFGYNLSVVNGPYLVMNQYLNDSFQRIGQNLTKEELNTEWSIAVSLYLIGGIVGSTWFPGAIVGTLGKKKALIIGAAIGLVGEVITFIGPYAHSPVPFMVGRSVVGFQGGLAMVIAPGYVNELTPARVRGAFGTFFSVGVATGLQITNLLGLDVVLGTTEKWPLLFIVIAGMYLFYGICLIFIVESPRWLLDKSMDKEAMQALSKLRKGDENQVRLAYKELQKMAEEEALAGTVSIASIFRDRRLWWPMIITINLHIANELTGISAVVIYLTLVISEGFSDSIAAMANFGVSFGLIVGALVCSRVVDRFGRRLLILTGLFIIVVLNVFLTIVIWFSVFEASIAGFAAYILIYNSGAGPIAWIVPAELFTQEARPLGLQVGMFTNWFGMIVVGFVFPIMQLHIGCFSFLPFAVIAALELIFFLFFLPETSSRLGNYSPEMFAPGKSLLQLKRQNKPRPGHPSSYALTVVEPTPA